MAADNIVTLTRHRSGPDSELAKSSATGEERLRELERLIKTAAEVQAQAEAELNHSEASQSVAQQRKAAADSVRRKAEAEMARLRTELARQAEQQKQVWSPGDPIRQQKSDFEVSTLTGSASRGRFSDSAFLDSDLALNDEDSQVNARINSSSGRSHKGRKAQPSTYKHHRSSKRGWAIWFFILLGISAGAGITWVGIQNPDAVSERVTTLSNRISNMIPVTVEMKSAQPETTGKAQATAPQPTPGAKPALKPARTAEQLAREQAAWQQTVAQQEQRVLDDAALRFRERTR